MSDKSKGKIVCVGKKLKLQFFFFWYWSTQILYLVGTEYKDKFDFH